MDPEPLPDVIETLTFAPTVVRVIPRHPSAGLVGEQARTWRFRNPLVATVRQVHANSGVETFGGRTHLVSVVDRVLVTLEEGEGRRGLLDALDPFAHFTTLASTLGRLDEVGAAVEMWGPAGAGWDLVFVPWWRPEEDPVPALVTQGAFDDLGVIEGEARRGGRTAWMLPAAYDGNDVPLTPYTWFVAFRAEADAVPPPRSLAP
jgi:hypothetical protein